MTSEINKRQNLPANINLLAAQRQLYTEAKRWMTFRLTFAILLALSPVVFAFVPSLEKGELFIAIVGLLATLVFPYFTKVMEEGTVAMAATIQEQFDTAVMGIEWNKGLVGEWALDRHINNANERYSGDRGGLADWYAVPEKLSAEKAALICQKSNLVWDSEQRKFYTRLFFVLAVLLALIPITWAAFAGMLVYDYLVNLLAPMLPLLALCIDNYRQHKEIAQEQSQKALEINYLLKTGGPISKDFLRSVQNSIFRIRKKHALVPNWIYRILRPSYEDKMKKESESE